MIKEGDTILKEGNYYRVVNFKGDHLTVLLCNKNKRPIHGKVMRITGRDFKVVSSLIAEQSNIEPCNEKGYIYLVTINDTSYFKIGKSIDVFSRIVNLNCNIPFKIILHKIYFCNFYHDAEKHLHDIFSEQNIRGEWFDLTGYHLAMVETYLSDYLIERVDVDKYSQHQKQHIAGRVVTENSATEND